MGAGKETIGCTGVFGAVRLYRLTVHTHNPTPKSFTYNSHKKRRCHVALKEWLCTQQMSIRRQRYCVLRVGTHQRKHSVQFHREKKSWRTRVVEDEN